MPHVARQSLSEALDKRACQGVRHFTEHPRGGPKVGAYVLSAVPVRVSGAPSRSLQENGDDPKVYPKYLIDVPVGVQTF